MLGPCLWTIRPSSSLLSLHRTTYWGQTPSERHQTFPHSSVRLRNLDFTTFTGGGARGLAGPDA